MPGERVVADPADLRRLASALSQYQQAVTDAGRRVQGALTGATWQDKQKTQFEDRLRGVQQTLNRFLSSEVAEMVKNLNTLAGRLEEIQQMRM